MANPAHEKAVAALLNDLNPEYFCHPETVEKMIYTLMCRCHAEIRRDQEV